MSFCSSISAAPSAPIRSRDKTDRMSRTRWASHPAGDVWEHHSWREQCRSALQSRPRLELQFAAGTKLIECLELAGLRIQQAMFGNIILGANNVVLLFNLGRVCTHTQHGLLEDRGQHLCLILGAVRRGNHRLPVIEVRKWMVLP